MATIKDVASLAGVSLSTVSIVANGQAGERKISRATQERVLDAMREVGYRPSVAARKLRKGRDRRQLTVFWADDFREVMLARFLKGLHVELDRCGIELDIGVETYRNGKLSRVGALNGTPTFDAAIIANAAPPDLAFLQELKPLAPMVLYNRELEGYASISVDDAGIGVLAAERVCSWLENRPGGDGGYVACLRAPVAFEGMRVRAESFCEHIRKAGYKVVDISVAENSAQGGYDAWGDDVPNGALCLFTPSDAVAMGVLHRCWEKGLRVPDDIGVISVGNGAIEYAEHSCPPLTCVSIPMEEMAGHCLELLGDAVGFQEPSTATAVRRVPAQLCIRGSM